MRLDGWRWLAVRTACWGGVAWGAFALVEAALLVGFPAARESALLLAPSGRLASSALVAGLYVAAGVAAGLVAGAVAALAPLLRQRREAAADLAQLTLVGAWVPHALAVRHLSRSVDLSLAAALLVAALLLVRLASRGRPPIPVNWSSWLVGPWGAALVLLAPLALRDGLHVTWLVSRVGAHAPLLKMGVSALAAVVLVGLLLAAGWHTARRGWSSSRLSAWQAGALPAVTVIALAAAWVSDARLLGRLGQAAGPVPAPPRATGVLVLAMDAVRADHLSTYGYRLDTSPGLRALASHATLFRHALAASDMSLGTHGSLFTGLYPRHHGAYEAPGYPAGRPLAPGVPTLAERLGAAGYAPVGAAANGYFLNAAYGLTRGFSLFDVEPNDRLEMRSRARRLAARLPGGAFSVHRPAAELHAVLLAGIDAARAGGRPFFAFANYMEAHAPYAPDPRIAARFGVDAASRLDGLAFLGRESRPVFDEQERRRLVSLYDASIATLDREISALFDALRARGLYDGSLVVVTSDHGEMLGEHGRFGHGMGLAEPVLRVPLIVKLPWQREGRVVDARVSQVDVMPTVLEALGLPPPAGLDGRSLLAPAPGDGRVVMAESPPARALYLGRFKLARDGSGTLGLFDVEADPGQRVNLLDAPDPLAAGARRALESELAAAGEGRRPALDPAALERLRSLGYAR